MSIAIVEEKAVGPKSDSALEVMFAAGAHYGYKRSRRHPSVSQYIFGLKNRVEIFDLEKTVSLMEAAKHFARSLAAKNAQILIVGTKFEARDAVAKAAAKTGQPYVINRWIGGTLTNLSEIRRRVGRLEELRSQKEGGELAKYTKKERLLLDREMDSLEKNFGGIINLKDLPGCVFIVDVREENTAVRESKRLGLPVIGLANSDCDLTGISYPVVGNDASRGSIQYFVDQIAEAYKTGLKIEK